MRYVLERSFSVQSASCAGLFFFTCLLSVSCSMQLSCVCLGKSFVPNVYGQRYLYVRPVFVHPCGQRQNFALPCFRLRCATFEHVASQDTGVNLGLASRLWRRWQRSCCLPLVSLSRVLDIVPHCRCGNVLDAVGFHLECQLEDGQQSGQDNKLVGQRCAVVGTCLPP